MGNACTTQTPESVASKAIDEGLKKDWEILSNEVRLLLLGTHPCMPRSMFALRRTGTGESGKSTIFKQMKLLQHNGGFAPDGTTFLLLH